MGTNASGPVKISGSLAPHAAPLTFGGADGSYSSASFVPVSAGVLIIYNTPIALLARLGVVGGMVRDASN